MYETKCNPPFSPLNVLPLGSYANRKPGLSGANYVGEKWPFSVSNAQLLREQVQSHSHKSWRDQTFSTKTLSRSEHHFSA